MTSEAKSSQLGPLQGAMYCVGGLLIAITFLDFGGTVWPLQLNEVSWRYGAIGLLSGFTLTPTLGGLLLTATAALAGQRRALRALSAIHLAVAVTLVLLIAGFALDALQVRRETAAEARGLSEMGSAKATLKLLLTAVAVGWIGIAGIRQSRGGPADAPSRKPLVTGRG